MKKYYLLLLSITFLSHITRADNIAPKDTTKVIDIEEIVVIASPKETTKLRQLPASVSLLSQKDMQSYQVNSLRNISSLVPNFFMPDYGSRLTSAVYIRGIGARINTPAVGLYVDNIPYIDKSAFDFNFYDIERIDILRGPQGTLYGRNTMGGLIKVHTRSPFTYQGTDLKLSAGTYNNYSGSLTHYHRISDKFAFSAGGFYEYAGGYFENTYLDKKADPLSAGGGRIRAIWLPSENLKLDFTVGYEYSDQGGYAYGLYHKDTEVTDPVAYNDESTYRRGLLNAGVNIEYQAKNFILSAVTGYQNMNDRMFMDQDFSTLNIYNITQKQKLNTLSEEIILKSKPGKNWQWTTGVFGFYQWLNTDGPVLFKEDGVKDMLEGNINKIFSGIPSPKMNLKINNPQLLVSGNFDTPVLSGAIYHQSTYNNLLVDGLSLTAGLRLDYEKNSMTYRSASDDMDFNFMLNMGRPMQFNNLKAGAGYHGKEKNDYLQLLPKFALKYDFDTRNNVYISVSKGYRSGGYNIQMFSDLIQSSLQNNMILEVKTVAKETIKEMMPNLPDETIDKMLSVIPIKENDLTVQESTIYKPEYSWNYEVGAHLSLFDHKLQADLAAFYMDTHDQQIACFSPNGFGRMTVNAGKSRSIGGEIALRTNITNDFSLNASYGYTHATFVEYQTNERTNSELNINYNDNFVPMVPRHTFCIGGEYIFRCDKHSLFDQIALNAYYSGAGKIFWTEKNDIAQDFYGTLNWRVAAQIKDVQIDLWARNFLNKDYTAFYFESMGNSFMQKGKPMQFGVDLRYKF